MQFTNRQMHFALQGAVVLALGVFLAMAGPFGTYGDLAPLPRYAYWVGLCFFGYGSLVVAALAMRALRRTTGAAAIAAAALASALPTTFAVAWAEQLLRLQHAVPLQAMPRVYGSVAAVQLLMLLLLTRMRLSLDPLLAPRPSDANTSAHVHHLPLGAPPGGHQLADMGFLARIPEHLGRDLLALQAEDHYLRVITALGSDLLLMRLADAMRELPAARGMQVHRSWWVAFEAVTAIERDAGRLVLVLSNGQQIPVSRTYQPAVRAADWPAQSRPSTVE